MILKKIYSEPTGLFPEVTFKKGVNFIFGKKDAKNSKKSLNGIGKSLFLDILDFCLCSNLSERLKRAKDKKIIELSKYVAVLEFDVCDKTYVIKRSFDKTGNLSLNSGDGDRLYKISEAKELLCDLIFKDDSYNGKYYSQWFRKLIPFFVKIQPPKKENFSDPLSYIQDVKIMELMQFHLLFLGIDNTLSHKNFQIKSDLKSKGNAIDGVRKYIEETYGLKNISDASNELDKLSRETKSLENKIKDFKLADQYKDSEQSSNILTSKIKNLIYSNYTDDIKLKSYRESSKINIDFDVQQIAKIYGDINEILGQNVKRTLEDAISFKKNLAKSREEFLKEEIEILVKTIKERNEEIKGLEEERAKIFKFLEAKEAIKDLSEAFLQLSGKQEKINELSGRIGLHTALVKEQAELKMEDAKLYSEIVNFVESIRSNESEIRAIFADIYNSIYIDYKDQSKFSILTNDRKDQKIEISIKFPSDLSKGKNQGRTLVYDLAVLFLGIKSSRNLPRFLVHDGIFDGMDKAHFVHLCGYLQGLSNSQDFQYIVTLNEEGILSDKNFGQGAENLTSQKIEQEAVLVLTPEKKLFNEDF